MEIIAAAKCTAFVAIEEPEQDESDGVQRYAGNVFFISPNRLLIQVIAQLGSLDCKPNMHNSPWLVSERLYGKTGGSHNHLQSDWNGVAKGDHM
jgi:hypothetical protein